MKSAYDVIVVGAGPGGSTAARYAADLGLDTLLLEKRQEVGAPVRCAEGICTLTMKRFIEPDPSWVAMVINRCRLIAPNGKFVEIEAPGEGLILERKKFGAIGWNIPYGWMNSDLKAAVAHLQILACRPL